ILAGLCPGNRFRTPAAARWLAMRALLCLTLLQGACRPGFAATPPRTPPPPGVAVVAVVAQDVVIRGEGITTLHGTGDAPIQPQVSGYLVRQTYVEGSAVRKGMSCSRSIRAPSRLRSIRRGAAGAGAGAARPRQPGPRARPAARRGARHPAPPARGRGQG